MAKTEIRASIGLDTTAFQRGMAKTQKSVNKFASNALRKFGAVAGAAGMGLLARRALDTANAIGDMSDRLGIATDELQDFINAGKLFNINQKVSSMGLQRFTRRVAEAQNGTGELKTTLEKYGIAVKNTDGTNRTARAVLGDLAEAMKGATTGGERLAIAFKAFDTEGADLVRILGQGKEAFEDFVRSGNEQFGKFDEGAIKTLRDAQTEIDKFTSKMTIMAGEIISVIIPALQLLGEGLGIVRDAFATKTVQTGSIKSFFKSIATDPKNIKDNYKKMWFELRQLDDMFEKGREGRAAKAKKSWADLNGDMVKTSKKAAMEISKSGVGGTDTGGTGGGSSSKAGAARGLNIERGEFEARNDFLRRRMKARNAHLTLNEKLRTQAMTGESAGITDALVLAAQGGGASANPEATATATATLSIAETNKVIAEELTRTK